MTPRNDPPCPRRPFQVGRSQGPGPRRPAKIHHGCRAFSRAFSSCCFGGGGVLPATDPQSTPVPETAPAIAVPDLKDKAVALREPLYRQAVSYLLRYRKDDLGQAVRLFNQILKTGSDFAPAHGGLAEARALRFLWGWEPDPDRLEQALDHGKKGVELGPDLAETHLGLGLAYMAADRYTPALAELDRAVEIDPGSFRAHLYRGMVLRGLRRTEEAGAEATRLLQIDPLLRRGLVPAGGLLPGLPAIRGRPGVLPDRRAPGPAPSLAEAGAGRGLSEGHEIRRRGEDLRRHRARFPR